MIFFCQANTLNCYAPKLEWLKSRKPVFHLNSFELVRCNTGLQKCFGGCNHCLAIDGPLQVKSCAGDMDITLEILGLNHDGCKNLTKADNMRYAGWISNSFSNRKLTLLSGFTKVCRCSWDGCNGLSTQELLKNKDLFAQNNASVGLRMTSAKKIFANNFHQLFILTIIVESSNKFLWIFGMNEFSIRVVKELFHAIIRRCVL